MNSPVGLTALMTAADDVIAATNDLDIEQRVVTYSTLFDTWLINNSLAVENPEMLDALMEKHIQVMERGAKVKSNLANAMNEFRRKRKGILSYIGTISNEATAKGRKL